MKTLKCNAGQILHIHQSSYSELHSSDASGNIFSEAVCSFLTPDCWSEDTNLDETTNKDQQLHDNSQEDLQVQCKSR